MDHSNGYVTCGSIYYCKHCSQLSLQGRLRNGAAWDPGSISGVFEYMHGVTHRPWFHLHIKGRLWISYLGASPLPAPFGLPLPAVPPRGFWACRWLGPSGLFGAGCLVGACCRGCLGAGGGRLLSAGRVFGVFVFGCLPFPWGGGGGVRCWGKLT